MRLARMSRRDEGVEHNQGGGERRDMNGGDNGGGGSPTVAGRNEVGTPLAAAARRNSSLQRREAIYRYSREDYLSERRSANTSFASSGSFIQVVHVSTDGENDEARGNEPRGAGPSTHQDHQGGGAHQTLTRSPSYARTVTAGLRAPTIGHYSSSHNSQSHAYHPVVEAALIDGQLTAALRRFSFESSRERESGSGSGVNSGAAVNVQQQQPLKEGEEKRNSDQHARCMQQIAEWKRGAGCANTTTAAKRQPSQHLASSTNLLQANFSAPQHRQEEGWRGMASGSAMFNPIIAPYSPSLQQGRSTTPEAQIAFPDTVRHSYLPIGGVESGKVVDFEQPPSNQYHSQHHHPSPPKKGAEAFLTTTTTLQQHFATAPDREQLLMGAIPAGGEVINDGVYIKEQQFQGQQQQRSSSPWLDHLTVADLFHMLNSGGDGAQRSESGNLRKQQPFDLARTATPQYVLSRRPSYEPFYTPHEREQVWNERPTTSSSAAAMQPNPQQYHHQHQYQSSISPPVKTALVIGGAVDNRRKCVEKQRKEQQQQQSHQQPAAINNKGKSKKKRTTTTFSSSSRWHSPPRPTPRGRRGLTNMGNTCFMNASLQALFHTPQLMGLCLPNSSNGDEARSNVGGSSNLANMENSIAVAFTMLAREVWCARGRGTIRPEYIMDCFKSSSDCFSFGDGHQHDAQEFIASLLHAVHVETNRVVAPTAFEQRAYEGKSLMLDEMHYHMQRKNLFSDSPFDELFNIRMINCIYCPRCDWQRVSFEDSRQLTVQLISNQSYKPDSLLHCLWQMFNPHDHLEPRSQRCTSCNTRLRNRKPRLWALPPVLIVHLKRFCLYREWWGWGFKRMGKNESPVDFPPTLNLSAYLHEESPNRGATPSDSKSNQARYVLNAVVLHNGSLDFGHYTALVREVEANTGGGIGEGQEPRWLHFNDSICSEVGPPWLGDKLRDDFYAKAAYVLIYSRFCEAGCDADGGESSIGGEGERGESAAAATTSNSAGFNAQRRQPSTPTKAAKRPPSCHPEYNDEEDGGASLQQPRQPGGKRGRREAARRNGSPV